MPDKGKVNSADDGSGYRKQESECFFSFQKQH